MSTGLRTVEQSISAGNDFDGTLPSGSVEAGDGIEAYPEGSKGGLFDLDLKHPVSVRTIELSLGGQRSFTLHKQDAEGRELLIFSGSREVSIVMTEEDAFVLTDKQVLLLRTFGATAALMARVSVQAFR